MIIGIFIANTDRNWGPGKLSFNTIKGFNQIDIDYIINEYGDYNFCLCGDKFNRFFSSKRIENTIIGPCSMNIPSDNISSFNIYDKFLVASEWYMNFWKTFEVSNVDYWFGGIDTELFYDNKIETENCFIYYKDRDYQHLIILTEILNELKINYTIIKYGQYTEEEFIKINNNSKFGIILSNTETQGFAIMESMSMNTPLFVLDKNIWKDKYYYATSVPYFSEQCGFIIKENEFNKIFIKNKLIEFIENVKHFEPRLFIENKFTIKHSVDLLLNNLNQI